MSTSYTVNNKYHNIFYAIFFTTPSKSPNMTKSSNQFSASFFGQITTINCKMYCQSIFEKKKNTTFLQTCCEPGSATFTIPAACFCCKY